MLTTQVETVNVCTCEQCGHVWKTLILPVTCGKCQSRRWNGTKQRGRPKNANTPPKKVPKYRIKREQLSQYDQVW